MGRKLDLSGLTYDEAQHVLKVVQRDMKLRKKEEERLSEMKQELAEEGSRCSILSKQHRFNEHCCIRCCAPFTFLLNPKRQCLDCQYNVCKTCCTYSERDKAWLCSACQKGSGKAKKGEDTGPLKETVMTKRGREGEKIEGKCGQLVISTVLERDKRQQSREDE